MGVNEVKVYVCAKFEDRMRARMVMEDLRDMGHTISYDWTRSEEMTQEQAVRDADGVLLADALVAIFEKDYEYKGALVEFGIAIGKGIPIFVLGNAPITRKLIFMHHPLVYRGLSGLVGAR